MAEEQDKKEEEKLEFDLAGQAIGYISLDQARVLAMRHVRENTGFYGEVYSQQELAWEELGREIVDVAIQLAYEGRNNSIAAEGLVWLRDNFSEEVLVEWEESHPALERGENQIVADYLHGQQKRMAIRQEALSVLNQVDAIVMPTGNTIEDKWDATSATIRGKTVPARSRAVYLNGMASQTGLPAVSIPCGFAKEGHFPVGLQLVGRDLEEALLLRLANAYEQATGWHKVHPAV